MTNKQRAEAIANVLKKLGVGVRKVRVLGAYVHIDTYQKYQDKIVDALSMAGLKKHSSSDGRHLDGADGFRMVFVA